METHVSRGYLFDVIFWRKRDVLTTRDTLYMSASSSAARGRNGERAYLFFVRKRCLFVAVRAMQMRVCSVVVVETLFAGRANNVVSRSGLFGALYLSSDISRRRRRRRHINGPRIIITYTYDAAVCGKQRRNFQARVLLMYTHCVRITCR